MHAPSKNQVDPYDFMDGVKYENLDCSPRLKHGGGGDVNHPHHHIIAIQVSSSNDNNNHVDDEHASNVVVSNIEAGGGSVSNVGSNKSIPHDHQISAPSNVNPVHANPKVHIHQQQSVDGQKNRGDGEALVVARNYGFM